jgi:hypothetical protein
MDKKKILKISLVIAFLGGVAFGTYKWIQHLRTQSGDPQKNNRRIIVKRLNIF